MDQGQVGEPAVVRSEATGAAAVARPGGDSPSYGSYERPLRGYDEAPTRLKLATLGVGLAMATAIGSAVAALVAYGEGRQVLDAVPDAAKAQLDELPDGITLDQIDGLNQAWTREENWLAPWAIAILLAAVCVLAWQIRANRNLPALGFRESRYGPVSGTLCWFVPLWQLVGPRSAINELWESGLDEGEEPAPEPPDPPAWLMLWWGLWLAATFGGRIAGALLDDGTLEQRVTASLVGGLVDLGLVVAGLLFIRIMWRITDRQRRRAGLDGLLPT